MVKWMGVVAAAGLAWSVAGSARADVVLFEDTFNGDVSALNATLSNWDISGGTIDVIGFDLFAGFCDTDPTGRCVDLDGTSNDAGRIDTKQTFDLIAGDYRLSFDLSGNQRSGVDTMTFGFGSFFDVFVDLPLSEPMQTRVFNFSLGNAASGTIFFDHQGGDNFGMILDNVRLVRVENVEPVPEPATLGLLGLALFAGARIVRRCA